MAHIAFDYGVSEEGSGDSAIASQNNCLTCSKADKELKSSIPAIKRSQNNCLTCSKADERMINLGYLASSQNNCLTCSKADVLQEDGKRYLVGLKITALHVVRRI